MQTAAPRLVVHLSSPSADFTKSVLFWSYENTTPFRCGVLFLLTGRRGRRPLRSRTDPDRYCRGGRPRPPVLTLRTNPDRIRRGRRLRRPARTGRCGHRPLQSRTDPDRYCRGGFHIRPQNMAAVGGVAPVLRSNHNRFSPTFSEIAI